MVIALIIRGALRRSCTRRRAVAGLGVLSTALLTACGGPGSEARQVAAAAKPAYFDLKGFLDEQRRDLESAAPSVTKTVKTDGAAPEIKHLARVNWERELGFFYEADLNKPALRGAYRAATAPLPGGGQRVTYTRKAGERGAVRWLAVETGKQGTVTRVIAEQDEQNALFSSTRALALHCDPAPAHNRLLSYAIEGRQKLVFFDATTYAVKGEVD